MLSTMQLEEYLFIPLIYVRNQKESTYAREVIMLILHDNNDYDNWKYVNNDYVYCKSCILNIKSNK